ncbi:type VI secretion system PAAR protein [Marinobacter sp. R17]|uniref:type VI secretion system PAAR protein n=1 Tax=Marinobacter TaxID=2742 RepID=UPI000F4D28C5|nr:MULTISPECIES: type VI secretion system PAAR protein [Marinobacter]ROT94453.1 type VI secretion system PAAR protein [Marinobacter sp. R17]
MGKKVVLLGDIGTDHEGYPPTPVIAASSTVLMDGKPVARQGDPLAPHTKPNSGTHPRAIAGGNPTVLVEGKPIALTGDAVTCGGIVIGSGSGSGG